MTYVKRRGMVLLVDDTQVAKYTGEGFEVYAPDGAHKVHDKPPKPPKKPKDKPDDKPEEKDDGSNGD